MKHKLLFILSLPLLLLAGCAHHQQPEDIRTMIKTAELSTVQFTVRQIIRNSDETWQLLGDRKVLFSCKATIKAGVNLAQLTDNDIQISGTSASIALPMPQIQSINLRPQDISVAYSKVSLLRTQYTQQERDAILRAGELAIKSDRALQQSIIAEAQHGAEEFFQLMLRSHGYTNITITFK
ncbi:MAG: DUF4230 domain-containing protein [Bacteroidales bacterium]|nr:DUF4230 domain-containing protein [Bacteroidales bacterium]